MEGKAGPPLPSPQPALPCHTHATHMRAHAQSTVQTNCRGQGMAGRQSHGHGIWTKPGVGSSLLNTESQRLLRSPTHSRASPSPIPWPCARAHSTSRSSSGASHHRGRLPSRCPLQGLGSTPGRALPSCGQPVGPLAPASPDFLGGSACSSLSPLLTAPAPGRGGTVPAGCQ